MEDYKKHEEQVIQVIRETGYIPVGKKCPFRFDCELGNGCRRNSVIDSEFSCAVARSFISINTEDASNGPISTLPGNSVKFHGTKKCEHCECAATQRVQGETDSMGCEYLFLCDKCAEKIRSHVEEDNCEWCGVFAVVKPMRDSDEGMAGPVYHVCKDCRDQENDRIAEEMRTLDAEIYDYGDETDLFDEFGHDGIPPQ